MQLLVDPPTPRSLLLLHVRFAFPLPLSLALRWKLYPEETSELGDHLK